MRTKLIHLFKPSSVTSSISISDSLKTWEERQMDHLPTHSPSMQKLPCQVPQTWEKPLQKFDQNFAFKNPTGYNELLLFPESFRKSWEFWRGELLFNMNFGFNPWFLRRPVSEGPSQQKKLGSINPPFKRKINATHPSISNPPHLFNGYRSKEIREVRGWLAIEGFFQGNEFVAPDISQSPKNHVRSAGVIGGNRIEKIEKWAEFDTCEKGWKVFHFGNLMKFRLHTFMQYIIYIM